MFRLAESEFKLFIEKLTDLFLEVDPQIPPLPPKDVIYRIYRDVRPNVLRECFASPRMLHRFDSVMTRLLTRQTSRLPFQGAEERVFSLVVRHPLQYFFVRY